MTSHQHEPASAMRLARRLGSAHATTVEQVPLAAAIGRTLARNVDALCSVPGFATSAMDGWAVAGEPPWPLDEAIERGDSLTVPLPPGHARPIVTGAPVPPGATAVLRSERGRTRLEARTEILDRLGEPERAGENIRREGEEIRAADRALVAGTVMTPPHVAVAASCGHDELSVRRRPLVDLFITGDEVVAAGVPGRGMVRDVFAPQVPWLIRELGGRIGTVSRLRDDLPETVTALRRSQAQVLITTAGSSHGATDRLHDALLRLDARLEIDGVAMRPGHPLVLATLPDGRMVLCLPGNPLAAVMGLLTIGSALLSGITGRRERRPTTVRSGVAIANRRADCLLVPYSLEGEAAIPTDWQGSAMMRGLADASGVMIVPNGGVCSGGEAQTLRLPWSAP